MKVSMFQYTLACDGSPHAETEKDERPDSQHKEKKDGIAIHLF